VVLSPLKESRSRVPPGEGSMDIWTFLSGLAEHGFFSILKRKGYYSAKGTLAEPTEDRQLWRAEMLIGVRSIWSVIIGCLSLLLLSQSLS